MAVGRFAHLAIGIAAALGKAHQCGLVHKDVKPADILVDCADGGTRLTGFGIASRLPRERQAPEPPEVIAGTLAYMAPEQAIFLPREECGSGGCCAGHDGDSVGHRMRRGREDGDAAAEPLHVNTVRQIEHVWQVVADQDDGQAVITKAKNEVEHLARLLDAHRGDGLVEDDDFAGEGGGPGHGDRLSLTTGQGLHGLAHVLQRADAKLRHFQFSVLHHSRLVELAEDFAENSGRPTFSAEKDVLTDIESRSHRKHLVNGLNPGVARVLRPPESDGTSVDLHDAFLRSHRPGEAFDQRGFAGSIVADNGKDFMRIQVEVGTIESNDPSEGLDQAARCENWVGPRRFRRGLI